MLEMFCGVAARRAVATADVTTSQAQAKMDPGHACFQALFTCPGPRGGWFKTDQVLAKHLARAPLLSFNAGYLAQLDLFI
jgi:hypothetical protein